MHNNVVLKPVTTHILSAYTSRTCIEIDCHIFQLIIAIRAILTAQWPDAQSSLLALVVAQLPDTRVRDRLLDIQALPGQPSIMEVARLGTSGYVVDSVPFALFCAAQVPHLGLTQTLAAIIAAGGDTDTNASLAGQVTGTWLGQQRLPQNLLSQLEQVKGYAHLQQVVRAACYGLPQSTSAP